MKKLLFIGICISLFLLFSCNKQEFLTEKFEGTAIVSYDYGTNNPSSRTDTFAIRVELLDATHFAFTWLKSKEKRRGKYEIKANGNYVFNTGNCEDNSWAECCPTCNSIGTPILGEFQVEKKDNAFKLSKEVKNVVSNNWKTTINLEKIE